MNVFVKPDEQSEVCFDFAMARTDGAASAIQNKFAYCRVASYDIYHIY